MPLRLAIAGASGRIGSLVLGEIARASDLACSAALVSPGNQDLGLDAGEALGLAKLGVPLSIEPGADFDVLLDFTLATALGSWIELCRQRRTALVVGATGHVEAQLQALRELAKEVPVLHAPNVALGPNLLMRMVRETAEQLGAGFQVEIEEVHHAGKLDAPSGTARALAAAVQAGNGQTPPIASERRGQVAGEHRVTFRSTGENLSFFHRAESPALFACGALRAARWISQQPPGFYDMQAVLRATDAV